MSRSIGDQLRDKVAVVTGARRGIGRATALELGANGAAVVVADNEGESELKEVAQQLRTNGGRASWVLADVRSRTSVKGLVDAAIRNFGTLDILVNNAGVESVVPLLELSDEEWTRVIDTDLMGTFVCLQEASRAMVAHGHGGAIVNLGSVQTRVVLTGRAQYAVAKRAVETLTAHAANELSVYGIRVHTVNPGMIATAMTEAVRGDPAALRKATSRIAMGRPGEPEEVARVIAFLVSDRASYMTGQSVYVDGGYALGWGGR